ncbi:hypothetical protein Aduo_005271 [Ancylostoma duodenale]
MLSRDDLYDRVILKCKEFRECTLAMTNLETRIKQLRLSKATWSEWSERYQQPQLLEITVDKIRVEFLFVRTQLRTLFALPPLMIALKKMKPLVWDTLIETPQLDEHDKPTITEQKTIEKVTADQLEVLGGYRSILAAIRSSLNEEKNDEESRFEDDMRQSIQLLQTSILREVRALSNQNSPAYVEGDRAQPNNPAGEGIPMSERERMAIQENAEFMDQVEEMNFEQDYESEVDSDERRRQIQQELNRACQELRDINSIINELEREKTCEPRRHHRGTISRERDRYMRCAFCDTKGDHYSDSCTKFVSVDDRKRELHARRRCEMCLETFRLGDRNCAKYFTLCYHCRGFGHHSSICPLPEKSVLISERLNVSRETRLQCLQRIRLLEAELEQLTEVDV